MAKLDMQINKHGSPDKPDRIYKALQKTLEAFFEGHGLPVEQQLTLMKQAQKDLEPLAPLPPPAPKKPLVSRVKIGSTRDIERMWAKHAKITRK